MISPKVMVELHQAKLVPTQFTVTKPGEHAWSTAEQRRFWEAIHRFPQGPWTAIAAYVGSKSTRQAMTHAQKLRQKLNRWKRRVRNDAVSSAGDCSPRSVAHGDMDDMDDLDDGEYDQDDDSESVCSVKFEHTDVSSSHAPELRPHAPVKSPLDVASLSPNDISCHDDTDDAYLEHLLSDIEPMLETVVNFTSAAPSASRSASSGECASLFYSASSYDNAVFPSAYSSVSDANSSSSFADAAQHYVSQSFDASSYAPLQHHQQYAAPSDVYMAPIDFRL